MSARVGSDELPQIWDELRKKVRDVRASLPPGAGQPQVTDDFGDVYGFLMAVVGDGFTYAELERYVDSIKRGEDRVDARALSLVDLPLVACVNRSRRTTTNSRYNVVALKLVVRAIAHCSCCRTRRFNN